MTHERTYHVEFANDRSLVARPIGGSKRKPLPSPCSTPDVAARLTRIFGAPVAVTVSKYDVTLDRRTPIEVVDVRGVTVAGTDWVPILAAGRAASTNRRPVRGRRTVIG